MTQTIHTRHVLELYGGTMIDYHEPRPEDIYVEDIARALSYTARFGGHTSRFYSVAEHALLVARLVEQDHSRDPALVLAALHHDSHEAYLGDLPTPLKTMVGAPYRKMATDFDVAVATAFGFLWGDLHHDKVKWADAVALRLEAYQLKHTRGFHPEWEKSWKKWGLSMPPNNLLPESLQSYELTPQEAEREFLRAHARLLDSSAQRPQ